MNSLNCIENKTFTRFPPEPNGYLHLGHAKAIYVNFTLAKTYKGTCNLRLDDTNPATENQHYIDSIINDIEWLGFTPDNITYTSDYFDKLYELAKTLIINDKAYVCELDSETIRRNRKDMIDSPYRNRDKAESLKLFEDMAAGLYKDGQMVLRMKCDMNSPNPNMRDMVAYRIISATHHRTNDKWKIYPTYDFSHPIVDSLEHISHSLCSMEFQTRNELYRWVLAATDSVGCSQIEYSRLNVTYTILSKRNLLKLVNQNIVSGWDDPRMPTIAGLRNRGYTSASIINFCSQIGLSLGHTDISINHHVLDECVRRDLDNKAPRLMAIKNPLKVVITNMSEERIVEKLTYPNLKLKSDIYYIKVGNIIYIERDDFRLVDSNNYYRLAPNKIVRLKYFGLIKCDSYTLNENGEINELSVSLLEYNPEKRVKGTINWVSHIDHHTVTVNEYEHLFPEKHDSAVDLMSQINLNSLKTIDMLVDSDIVKCRHDDKYQFERLGYYVAVSNRDNKIVMNRIVSLKGLDKMNL